MSHFTVLVIGQDPEKQLAPYHEFECTGEVDQYVQSIDLTAEKREEYETEVRKMVKVPAGTIVPDDARDLTRHPVHGTLVSYYADMFFVETGELDVIGRARKEIQLPEGYEAIEVPKKELMTFREFVNEYGDAEFIDEGADPDLHGDHKWGWVRVNAAGEVIEVIDRTNPNKKWDWYSLGGRWTGFFKTKPRTRGIQGRPGLLTDPAKEGYADQAFKMDIDFDGMRSAAEAEAGKKWDEIHAVLDLHPAHTAWTALRAKYQGETPELEGGINAAREAYRTQPAIAALREKIDNPFLDADEFLADRETYVRLAGLQSASTFAVLKDGVWHERGSMGWWGSVSDKKDDATWLAELGELLDGLPDDTLLSVYDCHI